MKNYIVINNKKIVISDEIAKQFERQFIKIDYKQDIKEYLDNADFNEEKPNKIMCQFSEFFDKDKFNWKKYSNYVAEYCPQHFDKDKFNWEEDSNYVAKYCPQHFDKDKFNWEDYSNYVAEYCPMFLKYKPN